jgi:hypothetical protein
MLRIASSITLLATVLLPLLGCSCLDRPYTPLTHSESWDPVLGSCGTCGVCEGDCLGHTPASFLKHNLTCGSGCGDIYWDEWLSDPPDPCDPCDDCGNWIGPQECCPPTMWDRIASGWGSLWGSRSGSCGSCGTCSTCMESHAVYGGSSKGEVIIAPAVPMIKKAVFESTTSPRSSLRSTRFTD